MANPNERKAQKDRKPYEKPTATRLTPEQAKLKLIDLASKGDQAAKDMLEALFPEGAQKLPRSTKKSA